MTRKPFPKLYIFWIAWRNLVARGRRGGLSFMTLISIFGVAIGVAALIIVLSVMGGFEQDLKDKMLRGQPHLEVMSQNAAVGFSLKSYPESMLRTAFPNALDVEAFTQSDVVLKQRRHLTSATLFGVAPERQGHLWGFGGAATEGQLSGVGTQHPANGHWDGEVLRPGIMLGEQLAEQLGADVGDEITVLSPQANVESALGGGTVSRQYVVCGKFRTGLFNYDAKWAVVSLGEGRRFMPDYDPSMDEDQYVSGMAMNVRDPMAIQDTVDRVFGRRAEDGTPLVGGPSTTAEPGTKGQLKDLTPLTWQKANKSLLFALKLEKFAMGSILMLIVVVAAFSISGTMMMTVYHKRGQVSLLRSLGMNRRDIARLYLAHGFTIGTVGILVGFGLGVGVCLMIRSFSFIHLPAGIYHLKNLPCKWLWFDYGVICACAWLFSLLASSYPALTAARQDPGQGLRYL